MNLALGSLCKKKRIFFRLLVSLFFVSITNHSIHAEEPFLKTEKASVWFGTRSLEIVNQNLFTESLDFLNYADNYNIGEYYLAGISWSGVIRNSLKVSLDVFTSDDIIPTSFRIDLQYPVLSWLGISGGLMQYPFLITGYEEFYKQNHPDFYTDGGPYANLRQTTFNDFVLSAGPVLNLKSNLGFLSVRFHLAYNSLLPKVETFNQKLINGNLRQQVVYKTTPSSNFFFFPDVAAGINILKYNNMKMGLQMQMSFYSGKRQINYTRFLRAWTESNESSEDIASPDHLFRQTDISMGIYWHF